MSRKRRHRGRVEQSDQRRRRRIRRVLGIWLAVVILAAIAYACQKRLYPSSRWNRTTALPMLVRGATGRWDAPGGSGR